LKLEWRVTVVYFDDGCARAEGVAVFSVLARLLKHTWAYTNNDRKAIEAWDEFIPVIDVNRDFVLVHYLQEKEPKNAGL
jgi:hypothetical protein